MFKSLPNRRDIFSKLILLGQNSDFFIQYRTSEFVWEANVREGRDGRGGGSRMDRLMGRGPEGQDGQVENSGGSDPGVPGTRLILILTIFAGGKELTGRRHRVRRHAASKPFIEIGSRILLKHFHSVCLYFK